MIRDAWFLTRMDLRLLFRSRATWLWAFVMPVVFFYFIGTVTGGAFRPPEKDAVAVLVPPDAGFLADQFLMRLKERDYRVVRARSEEHLSAFRRRLRLPAGFTASVLAGRPVTVKLERSGGGGLDAGYDEVRIGRAVYAVLADLIVIGREGAAATPERFAQLAARPRNVTVQVASAGVRIVPPTGFQQSVPGNLVMFILLVMFTSGSVTLTLERDRGILRRLASSPMSRPAVVVGKFGARFVLGMVQIAFAMLAGMILFRLDWGPHPVLVVAVLTGYAALAAVAGMLLGNFARSDGQAIGIGVLASNVLAALGGCWWPIEVTPAWAQKVALALPTGWAMDALHKLISFGAPPVSVLSHLAALGASALLAAWLLARRFRFQ
jgi:ABC-2 type transport system permease protein